MICEYCQKREATIDNALCVQCLEKIASVHYCPDWDFLIVHRAMPEFDSCTCSPN